MIEQVRKLVEQANFRILVKQVLFRDLGLPGELAKIRGADAVSNQSARNLLPKEQVGGDQHFARRQIDLLDETVSRITGKPERGDDVAQQRPSQSQPGLGRGILIELT